MCVQFNWNLQPHFSEILKPVHKKHNGSSYLSYYHNLVHFRDNWNHCHRIQAWKKKKNCIATKPKFCGIFNPKFCEGDPNRDIAISTLEKFETRPLEISVKFWQFSIYLASFYFNVHKSDTILLQALCLSWDMRLIEKEALLTVVLYVRSSPVFTIAKTGVSL